MSQEFKKIIAKEYLKCAKDPVHFMKKYCYIQHPQRGRLLFNLYPFQEKVLKGLKQEPYNIILKSRQLGISTLAAGYSLWLMTFHENKNILALATTLSTAQNLVDKVRFMHESLPSWLKVKDIENNKRSITLQNGSKIHAKSSNSEAARSEAVSLLIVDEAAFIDNIAETWASAQQTLATGGGAIVLSTPNGTGNWFHKMWTSAETGENQFQPIKLRWDVHPERDASWRKEQDDLLGDPRLAAQECDCDFSTSGKTVFYHEHLDFLKDHYIEPPLEKRGVDQNLWVWKPADYTKEYMILADVARGDSSDYSAFHIVDIENNEQVAEYRGQLTTKDYGHLLVGIATEYNNALLVVENNNIGWATIQVILDRGYQNLYYSPRGGVNIDSYFDVYTDTSSMVAGFTNSSKTRPLVISKFQESVADQGVIIHSKRLFEEMKVFVWKNGRAEAQQGYNDDLVMSFGIGQYIRNIVLQSRQRGIEATKKSISNISMNKTTFSGGTANIYNGNDNPYLMETKDGKEDISWLFR